MANENIIGPELEESQQPPVTSARCVLNQLFAAASTSFTTICNQPQPQEVILCDLELKLTINHSPSDTTSTHSDRELHISLSSGGNWNKIIEENVERTIGIAEINLVHHQEEVSETNIDSSNNINANDKGSDSKEEDLNREETESEEKNNNDSSEFIWSRRRQRNRQRK